MERRKEGRAGWKKVTLGTRPSGSLPGWTPGAAAATEARAKTMVAKNFILIGVWVVTFGSLFEVRYM